MVLSHGIKLRCDANVSLVLWVMCEAFVFIVLVLVLVLVLVFGDTYVIQVCEGHERGNCFLIIIWYKTTVFFW